MNKPQASPSSRGARATQSGAAVAQSAPLSAEEREQFFAALRAAIPHPETELEYTSPFELLVAVVLSAQATDASVNRATRRLFPVASTPAALVALGEERLAEYLKSIGLYRTKTRNVIALSRQILERHGGNVPTARAELEALPGVGRKTANVILNIVFGEPTIAVDTHIFRIANRTGLAPGKDVRAVEDRLVATTPPAYLRDAHHLLILHGRYTCKALRPECWRCPVLRWCHYPSKVLTPKA